MALLSYFQIDRSVTESSNSNMCLNLLLSPLGAYDDGTSEEMVRPPSPLSRPGSQRVVSVQRAGSWLGGGRDLHWQKQLERPKSAHVPGWKVGMPTRPKSAAATRALRYTDSYDNNDHAARYCRS